MLALTPRASSNMRSTPDAESGRHVNIAKDGFHETLDGILQSFTAQVDHLRHLYDSDFQMRMNSYASQPMDLPKFGSGVVPTMSQRMTHVDSTNTETSPLYRHSDNTQYTGKSPLSLGASAASIAPFGSISEPGVYLEDLDTSSSTTMGYCHSLATSVLFEVVFAVLLILNFFMMSIECEYQGFGLGFAVDYPKYNMLGTDYWPGAGTTFTIIEIMFGAAFTFEVLVKMIALGLSFFKSWWNMFDMAVIGFWLASMLGTVIVLNPMFLRLVRLSRLLRLLRLVRTFQVFDCLRLLVGSLRASSVVLLWTFALLALIMSMTGLALNFLLKEAIILNESIPLEQRQLCFEYFGSFSRSFISMYELTLSNWVPITRMLHDINEGFGPLLIVYQTLITFAVMNVIRAIFIHETMKVANDDEDLIVMDRERRLRRHGQLMQRLLNVDEGDCCGDEDGDEIDFLKFHDMMADSSVTNWLAAMQLEVRDPAALFSMLDSKSAGKLTPKELSNGFARLKGAARAVDVVALMHEQRLQGEAIQLQGESMQELRGMLEKLMTKMTRTTRAESGPHLSI